MNKRNGRSSSKIMKKSFTSGDHSRINKKPKSRGERKPRTERRKKREDNTTVVGNQLASNNNGANEDKLEESISELLTVLEIKDPAKKRRSARLQKEKRKGKKAKKISSHTKPDESTNLDIHNNQRRRVSCSEDEDTGRILLLSKSPSNQRKPPPETKNEMNSSSPGRCVQDSKENEMWAKQPKYKKILKMTTSNR